MLAAAALTGGCLGGVYDICRILRLLLQMLLPGQKEDRPTDGPRPGDTERPRQNAVSVILAAFRFVTDLVFAVLSSVALILLCYYTNDGQLRAPAVIGMACGFFVYMMTLSRLVMAIANRLLTLAVAVLYQLLRPFRRLIGHIARRARAAHEKKSNMPACDEAPSAEPPA